jgi:hypothetical protein
MNHYVIDNLNYFNDSRNRKAPSVTVEVEDPITGDYTEVTLPSCWAICDVCQGEGQTVNPSIDAGGLSADLSDDLDFMEDYMGGVYDVACGCCGGSGKVRVLDRDTAEQTMPEALQAYDDEQEAEMYYAAERRAEIMMGC